MEPGETPLTRRHTRAATRRGSVVMTDAQMPTESDESSITEPDASASEADKAQQSMPRRRRSVGRPCRLLEDRSEKDQKRFASLVDLTEKDWPGFEDRLAEILYPCLKERPDNVTLDVLSLELMRKIRALAQATPGELNDAIKMLKAVCEKVGKPELRVRYDDLTSAIMRIKMGELNQLEQEQKQPALKSSAAKKRRSSVADLDMEDVDEEPHMTPPLDLPRSRKLTKHVMFHLPRPKVNDDDMEVDSDINKDKREQLEDLEHEIRMEELRYKKMKLLRQAKDAER